MICTVLNPASPLCTEARYLLAETVWASARARFDSVVLGPHVE